ncbi:hypothetical protein DFP72DRAFT_880367, partial [Ephemerocybe angulata]
LHSNSSVMQFLVLLILHLWLYDKFACLKWDSGRQPGAFKRIMTYSYLGTLPTLIVFSVALTVIKYNEGYIILPDGKILPTPFEQYDPSNKRWLLPLFLVLSFLVVIRAVRTPLVVTHLEELTFWLFLLHQGPGKRDWFHCWEFRTWYLGSSIAVLGMPITALITRHQVQTTLAYIFLVGSSAGTVTTICFLYVIFRFPAFLEYVKAGGADPDVIVRLATCIRVVFRFLFSLPLLMIAVDALRGPYPIVGSPYVVLYLPMIAVLTPYVSGSPSVFFPRSITHEAGYRVKIISPQTSAKPPSVNAPEYFHDHHQGYHFHDPSNPIAALDGPATPASGAYRMSSFRFPQETRPRHVDTPPPVLDRRGSVDTDGLSSTYDSDGEVPPMRRRSSPIPPHQNHPVQHSQSQPGHKRMESFSNSGTKSDDTVWEEGGGGGGVAWPAGRDSQMDGAATSTSSPTLRRHNSDGPFVYNRHGKFSRLDSSKSDIRRPVREVLQEERPVSQLHPYLLHFTSPIDLMDGPYDHEHQGVV